MPSAARRAAWAQAVACRDVPQIAASGQAFDGCVEGVPIPCLERGLAQQKVDGVLVDRGAAACLAAAREILFGSDVEPKVEGQVVVFNRLSV